MARLCIISIVDGVKGVHFIALYVHVCIHFAVSNCLAWRVIACTVHASSLSCLKLHAYNKVHRYFKEESVRYAHKMLNKRMHLLELNGCRKEKLC